MGAGEHGGGHGRGPGRALMPAAGERLLGRGVQELLRPLLERAPSGPKRDFSLSHSPVTVIVERWWKVILVEDTKQRPKEDLELILTQAVEDLGVRGDLISVKKSVGRNRLLPQGLAVDASPENEKLFEGEKWLRQEGKLEKIQTKAGEATVKFPRSCHLEVGMKNNVKREGWPPPATRCEPVLPPRQQAQI
uniref:Large ribosomal subunit protein bL9m n=1 Tax=Oryctolagus cuniculus TaxID=9986 RepID=A0A5F9DV35_RABIT